LLGRCSTTLATPPAQCQSFAKQHLSTFMHLQLLKVTLRSPN
jgi:hypothetical protein